MTRGARWEDRGDRLLLVLEPTVTVEWEHAQPVVDAIPALVLRDVPEQPVLDIEKRAAEAAPYLAMSLIDQMLRDRGLHVDVPDFPGMRRPAPEWRSLS